MYILTFHSECYSIHYNYYLRIALTDSLWVHLQVCLQCINSAVYIVDLKGANEVCMLNCRNTSHMAVQLCSDVNVMTSLKRSYAHSVEVKVCLSAMFNVNKNTTNLHYVPQSNNH